MSNINLALIFISIITALLLALFQYVYKSKLEKRLKVVLSILRFISIFCVFLLLINPKIESTQTFDEQPNLVIAIDNSESISYLKQNENVVSILDKLKNNSELNSRFNIDYFSFGKNIQSLDSLSFSEKQSQISSVFKNLNEVYKNKTAPIVFISDGNQTFGEDYSYVALKNNQSIYPVILGDTTTYEDLSIKQVNVNRYAFLKNKFPIEIIANYSGSKSVNTELKITSGGISLFRKTINFSKDKTSQIINTNLLASKVGIATYKVELTPLNNEKNKVNNIKNFAVEVIDQKSNIALISAISHPDIGAIKKAIETNEQHQVQILKPDEFLESDKNFQLVILYQPDDSFSEVFETVKKLKFNQFIITGLATDYEFLNETQNKFKQTITNQTEEYQPLFNEGFNNFIVSGLDFESFPPLNSEFGAVSFDNQYQSLLFKTVSGINTGEPLLSILESNNEKLALLNGEGIWRWRAQSFLNQKSFFEFDNFLGKLVQYLSSNQQRQRLTLDYKSFYNGNDNIVISAQYFNKNFEFDNSANLIIRLNNIITNQKSEFPLLFNGTNYEVDLSGVPSGNYDFKVTNNSEKISATGRFQILEYNIEQQFLNADVNKLQSIANSSDASSYFTNQTIELINNLLEDKRYLPIQKSIKNIVPLISWYYLLILIAISLSAEWFIRKYNGLI